MASSLHLAELRLLPGSGIEKIAVLDSTVTAVIAHLQSFSTALPSIEFITNTETRKLYIRLPQWGVTLVFDERYQMLELLIVDVRDTRLSLYLDRTFVRSPDDFRREVGDLRARRALRGAVLEGYEGVSMLVREGDIEKVMVHSGSDCLGVSPTLAPQIPVVEFLPDAQMVVHHPKQSCALPFGSPPEDVIEAFGLPSKVVYLSAFADMQSMDYIYNYFEAGLDFRFDGRTNRLREVVARNNLPEDCHFGVYHRCQFRATVAEGKTLDVLSTLSDVQAMVRSSAQISQQPSPHNFDPVTVCALPSLTLSFLPSGFLSCVSLHS